MATNPVKINGLTLAVALGVVVAAEVVVGGLLQWSGLPHFGRIIIIRLVQIGCMFYTLVRMAGDLTAIGAAPATWFSGLKKGALWSMAFAAVAAAGMAMLHLSGQNPFKLIYIRLPSQPTDLIFLFLAGGLVAPIAEELLFRGILYTYFRRWGIVTALIASTAIFVVLHFNALPIPATQLVGGLVFAIAYETSHNLITPITIHVLGNTALFALSLPVFHA